MDGGAMRHLLGSLVVMGLAVTAAAEPLTLVEAMRRAREQGRDVAAAGQRLEASSARAAQARGFRLPQVVLSESWISTDSPAEAFALVLNQERFSFADFVAGDPNHPERLETAITRLEIALPLYTGGELSGRIRQAGHMSDAARAELEWTGSNAALAAAEAYVMLAQAREYGGLLERARETVAAHVELARAYAEQGMLVTSEVLRAEVELARVEDLVAEAEGNGHVAEANLAFRMGEPLSGSYELATLPLPAPLGEEMESWLAGAAARGDLRAAKAKLAAGELEVKVARAALLPRVGVLARGDLVDDTLFGSNGDSAAIMANAAITLWHGGAHRDAVRAARHEAAAGREDVARFEQGVELSVRQAYEAADVARRRHATATKAVSAAREAERITEERFRSGVVKMIDLLDVTTALREAETRELVARAEATAALLRLAVAAGRAPESALSNQ
jgi:outer membrane protein TolC